MRFFLFALTTLIFALQAHGKTPLRAEDIIYNPGGNLLGQFVVAYKDYEDMRIDADLDGLIDFWRIKKGSLQIELFFKSGQVDRYFVRKLLRDHAIEYNYKASNGKLLLVQARVRGLITSGFSSDICEDNLKNLEEELKKFSSDVEKSTATEVVSNSLLDPSCKEKFGRDATRIASAFLNALDPKGLSDCFNSDHFDKSVNFGKDDQLSKKILRASFSLQAKQLIFQSENYKGILKCEFTDKKDFAPAATSESGTITFYKSSEPSAKLPDKVKETVEHELLHRLGIFSEDTVKGILNACSTNKIARAALQNNAFSNGFGVTTLGNVSAASVEDIKNQTANIPANVAASTPTTIGSSLSSGNVSTSAEQVAAESTANIPREIAAGQVQTPPAARVASAVINPPPATDAGAQQALVQSASDSGGVIRAANNLIGSMSTPALANNDSSARAASSRRDSSSEVTSSTSTITDFSSGTKSRVPASVALQSRDKLANDERVVEQITVDGGDVRAPETARVSNDSRTVKVPSDVGAARATNTSVGSNAVSAPSSSEIALSSSSVSGGNAPLGSSVSSSTPQRGQSNSRSASRAPAAAISKDEVITFFSRGDYSVTKRKLKDPSFQQELKSQDITVLDFYGNTYGAPKGSVIFLDQGDRFVRQK